MKADINKIDVGILERRNKKIDREKKRKGIYIYIHTY
jgi:hypothetical protein